MEKITLYYREGASDKVYQAALESKDGGYVVTFAYGRRGATLTTGTKTQAPVSYAHRGGCIFQPVYLGVRDDIRDEECTVSQLKYKAEPARMEAA